MKRKKVVICAVAILLILGICLILTPNALMCRLFLATCRDDFDRCVKFILDSENSVSGSMFEPWYLYDGQSKIYTTGDAKVDASISKITSIYLFARIYSHDGRVFFALNRIPFSRKTGYALQYAPNDDPLEYYGYDLINEPLGDGWYYTYFSDIMSG